MRPQCLQHEGRSRRRQRNFDKNLAKTSQLAPAPPFTLTMSLVKPAYISRNKERMKNRMKKSCLLLLTLCAGAFAQSNTVVRWRGIQGVITAPGVDNPVSQIHSGAGPWTTQAGNARINVTTGEGSFKVEGLVLNGGTASGTPGAVTSVMGSFVCNPGSAAGAVEAVIDTPLTSLSSTGNAELSFKIDVPAVCDNPVFLIRVPAGLWIATGTKPATGSTSR